MRIAKSRLLQIIREEVELHEKNTLELDEETLEELTSKQGKNILKKAVEDMEGNELDEEELEEKVDVGEEKLFYKDKKVKDPQSGKMVHPVIEPKTLKSKDILSVKLR